MSTDAPTSMISGCGVCTAPTGDGACLCRTHTDDLRNRLAGVPGRLIGVAELVAELDITVTRQARTAQQSEGGRSTERPLAWNENASRAAFELNATLNGWALDTSTIAQDERDLLVVVPHWDTAGLAAWLARNISTLRQHAEAGRAYDDILNAVKEACRAIDRPTDPVPFGPCHRIFEDGTICQQILYGQLDRAQVPCRACGSLHATRERLVWMLEYLRGMLATLPELVVIASLAGKATSVDKLRLMASRGRFLPHGVNVEGVATFRVSEALQALDDRYKHRARPVAA